MDSQTEGKFLLIGGGWRAEFYLRIALKMPNKFQVTAIFCPDKELRDKYSKSGFACFDSLNAALKQQQPDFIVICVNRFATAQVIKDTVKTGLPILTETPLATNLEELTNLFQSIKDSSQIQVAEQYHLRPDQQARYQLILRKLIGAPVQALVSLTNNYHAISLLRHFLGTTGSTGFTNAQRFILRGLPGFGREGVSVDNKLTDYEETIASFDFNGKIGLYNFESDQHRSFIRTQHIQIKGTNGVIDNDIVKYINSNNEPITSKLERINIGENENMEGIGLKGIIFEGRWVYQNPFLNIPLSDDEIALATLLQEMIDYCHGGPEVYSVANASQDFYLTLAIEEAVETAKSCPLLKQPWAGCLR